jgi:1,4-dihydroxy-2-naphthoate octaprenyltransferase
MIGRGTLERKVKAHLWTLPRWFAAPLFGAPAVLGGLMSGGMTVNSWLGVVGALLVMAGGHSFNTFLDYAWTGLDKGKPGERSAEKNYAGGQSVIAAGIVSEREVALNAMSWYVLALIPLAYLALKVGWQILLIGLLGMLVTFAYARSKFNWTHEMVLGIASGPLAVLSGMFATTSSPSWTGGLVVSVPSLILISFVGLAIDEWPDAEANLRKGVKSVAYKVWEYGVSLEWYVSSWLLFMYIYQVFLIAIGLLRPLSAISFLTWPFLISFLVLSKRDFRKWAGLFVYVAVTYPVLLVLGQFLSG